jgi:hypothetical protein
MKSKSDIEKKVEDTLSSLDDIQRATPQPWLFSRVKAKLLRETEDEKTIWGVLSSFLSKPAVAIAALFLILFFNGVFLYNQYQGSASSVAISDELQPNDSESLIASSSSFDYENLVQP